MAILADLLRGILTQDDQTTPMNRLAMISGEAGTAGPIGSEMYQNALSSLSAPQQPVQAGFAPSAPQGQGILSNAPQAAPQPAAQPSGGGFLSNLFNPGGSDRNLTVNWLVRQGEDPGYAKLIASNPRLLQEYAIQKFKGVDPKDALQQEKLRLEIEGMKNPTPDSVKALDERARRAGLQPGSKAYQDFMRVGGDRGISVNVDTGTIPQGYQAVRDEQGRLLRYEVVPGGPADMSQKDEARANQQQVTSDTVINAARLARQAVDGSYLPATGTGSQTVAGWFTESNAAEVRRQVDALKAVAASENINAMRQASPTGGALGNASDADIKLLKDKAGALDPGAGAERFRQQLDDYERTLLRIVHGKAVGDAIFEQTRASGDTGNTSENDPLGIR